MLFFITASCVYLNSHCLRSGDHFLCLDLLALQTISCWNIYYICTKRTGGCLCSAPYLWVDSCSTLARAAKCIAKSYMKPIGLSGSSVLLGEFCSTLSSLLTLFLFTMKSASWARMMWLLRWDGHTWGLSTMSGANDRPGLFISCHSSFLLSPLFFKCKKPSWLDSSRTWPSFFLLSLPLSLFCDVMPPSSSTSHICSLPPSPLT